jgi:sorting and assembly machinery component 37
VSSLLGKTSQNSPFKLAALTAELFQPLQQLLGDKEYLLSDTHPTTLDALVLGYLALAYVPDLPAPWLRESLKSKTPRLATYIERMRQKYFGEVQVADAFSESTTDTSLLPWRRPADITATRIGGTLLNTLADATPVLKDLRTSDRLRETVPSPDSDPSRAESNAVSEKEKNDLYIPIASVAAGVAALVGYLFHVGVIPTSSGDEPVEKEDYQPVEFGSGFGSAGDFLSAI